MFNFIKKLWKWIFPDYLPSEEADERRNEIILKNWKEDA